jgi:hypothetical protein
MKANLTLATAASLLALAACASTPAPTTNTAALQLASSATSLDENARVLAQSADIGTPSFNTDAHLLQQSTFNFRQDAASGRVSNSQLKADFDQVTRAYEAVRSDVKQLNTAEAQGSFQPVKDAYHEVASRMGSAPAGAPGS